MKKSILAVLLCAGLLMGNDAATNKNTERRSTNTDSHAKHRRRGSASRSIGKGAIGGAALGALVGRGRGALIGGAMGAGAGALYHRNRKRKRDR